MLYAADAWRLIAAWCLGLRIGRGERFVIAMKGAGAAQDPVPAHAIKVLTKLERLIADEKLFPKRPTGAGKQLTWKQPCLGFRNS